MQEYVKNMESTTGKKGKGGREAVTLWQQDDDRALSREDLSKLGKLLGMNLTRTELDQAMVEIDVAKKGTVTLDEFNVWFHSEKSSLIRKINKSKEDQAMFQRMRKKEKKKILASAPTQAEVVTALFQRLDKSNVVRLPEHIGF